MNPRIKAACIYIIVQDYFAYRNGFVIEPCDIISILYLLSQNKRIDLFHDISINPYNYKGYKHLLDEFLYSLNDQTLVFDRPDYMGCININLDFYDKAKDIIYTYQNDLFDKIDEFSNCLNEFPPYHFLACVHYSLFYNKDFTDVKKMYQTNDDICSKFVDYIYLYKHLW